MSSTPTTTDVARSPRRGRRMVTSLGLLAVLSTAFTASSVFEASSTNRQQATGPSGAYQPVTRSEHAAGQTTNLEVPLADGVEPFAVRTVEVGRDAAEPTIGVTSDGTAFFAAGTFDSVGGAAARTEVMRSTDGGLSWTSVQPVLPGLRSEPGASLDPMVYVDDATDRVFNLELYIGCSYLIISDDDFETTERNPLACGNFVNDHQTMITGVRPPAARVPELGLYGDDEGDRWTYYCFNRVADSNCGRSFDGGLTWTPTPQPAFFGFDTAAGGLCGGLHGHIATDPDGRLLLPKGHCGRPWIAVSEDGGDSWTRVRVSDIASRGTHLSVASDAAGTYYLVWWDTAGAPWLSRSKDAGRTWDEPLMIAPPGVLEVNFPVIDAGDAGAIAINFPGTPETGNRRAWYSYVVVSTDADQPRPTFQYAQATAEPVHRGNCTGRCGGLWDFQDVVISSAGEVWAAAADGCKLACNANPNAANAQVGMGLAIRQVSGPTLRSAPAAE